MLRQTHEGATHAYFWHPMGQPGGEAPARKIARGEGVHVIEADGTRLLDATSGGLANVTLGYSAAAIKEAIARQLDILPYHSAFHGFTHDPAEELAARLIDEWFAPEGMTRVFFGSGGSDAVDTALRLARQYWKIQKAQDRYKFIALRNGYHGTHFGGASLSSKANIRRNYEPLLQGCFHIPTPWTYRNPFDEQDPQRLGEICARLLEEEIVFQGADTVAAFIAEPVTGAGGLVVPPANFWPLVRKICDKYGVLLIADEVITGYGRTGYECGSRDWGVKPDLMCTAKAITSGYFPLGATLVNERMSEAFEGEANNRFASIGHGYTYSGHPVGCAAGIAALDLARKLRVWDNAKARGEELMAGLQRLHQKHTVVGEARGRGLMTCLEIVLDRKQKTPADAKTMARIADGAREAGVMIRVSGSNINISPPLIVEKSHIDQIVEALDAGLSRI